MFDRMEISIRFFSCYPDTPGVELAKMFHVKPPTITEWAKEGTVPWRKLKFLSDSQGISWDWLIAGKEPKYSGKQCLVPTTTSPQFRTMEINQRFLSLFGEKEQPEIAAILKVTSATVSTWNVAGCQVSWKRLAQAVEEYGVTWNWLIDGIESA